MRVRMRRLVAARYLSRAGSEAAFFTGIWAKAAFSLKGTPADLAAVMFSLSVASILGSAAGGVLVDRYGPRRVLVVAELFFVPAALAMMLARDITVLTALVAIWGFTGAYVVTAGASFAPFIVPEGEDLQRANAWIEGAGSAAFITGPAFGALIVHFASVDWVFALDAATSLIASALVWTIPVRTLRQRDDTGHRAFAEFRSGLALSFGTRTLRFYMLAGVVVWLSFGAFGALEPLFYRDVVHTGPETIGWVNAIGGLGFIAGASILARLPKKALGARVLTLTVAATGISLIGYVATPDLRWITLGLVVWGVFVGLMEPLLRTLIHRDAPPEAVGRVVGTAEIARRFGELLPLAVVPALAARFGVQPPLIGAGLLAALLALTALPEAAAIDKAAAAAGPRDVRTEAFKTTDEPISPNP